MWLSLLFIFTKLTHVFSYVTNLEKGLPFGLLKRSVTFMETSFLKELYIHGSRCCHKKPCLYMNASFFFFTSTNSSGNYRDLRGSSRLLLFNFYKLLFLWETTTFDGFYVRFSAPTKRVVPCVSCTHILMVFTSLLISNGCISIYAPIVRKMTMKKKKAGGKLYKYKNHSYEVYAKT